MPAHLEHGGSTAVSTNVQYRLGKLREWNLIRGVWLDCGCADGGYTRALVSKGAECAVGIDLEAGRVQHAQEKNSSPSSVLFACASSDTLPFPDSLFDGVLLNEVLEHVLDELRTLSEIYRVLRPGGHLLLMSPNRWFPFEGHGMRFGKRAVPVPVPFLPWLPSKLALRVMCARNYWPAELRDLVRRAGFDIRASGSILPVFEVYPWLPSPIIRWYRSAMPTIEQLPVIRHCGVSTFVLAQRS